VNVMRKMPADSLANVVNMAARLQRGAREERELNPYFRTM